MVTSLTLANQPVAELFGHSEHDLQKFLAARDPSVGAILESLTTLYADKQGKPRWAEKTPNHLLHLPTIRAAYPKAPIVRIVRDPRDSALSMRQLPWASPSALANGFLWTAWFNESQSFFERDLNTLTVRYEDLVSAPETVLTEICNFIGETFEPGMLAIQKTGKSVSSPNESWKASNTCALDPSRTQLWQRQLNPAWQRALSRTCAGGIEAFGYPAPARPEVTLSSYPLTLRAVETYEANLLDLLAAGVQLEPGRLQATELLLLPSLAKGKKTLFDLFKVGRLLLVRRAKGQTTYYLPPNRLSWAERLLNALCQTLATPYAQPIRVQPGPEPAPLTLPSTPSTPRLRSLQRTRYWVGRARGRSNLREQARD